MALPGGSASVSGLYNGETAVDGQEDGRTAAPQTFGPEALAWMAAHPEYDELVIGGGGEIYALWLPYAAHLRLSRLAGRFDCDTFFPKWDPQEWICRKQTEEDGFLLEEWDRTKL